MRNMTSCKVLAFSFLVGACQPTQTISPAPSSGTDTLQLGQSLGTASTTTPAATTPPPLVTEQNKTQASKYISERERVSSMAGYPWDLVRADEMRGLQALGFEVDLKALNLFDLYNPETREAFREDVSQLLRKNMARTYKSIMETGGRPAKLKKIRFVYHPIQTHVDADTLLVSLTVHESSDVGNAVREAHRAQARALKLDGVRVGVRYFDAKANKQIRDDWEEMDKESDEFVSKHGEKLLSILKAHRSLVQEIRLSEHPEPFSYDSRTRTLYINPNRVFDHEKFLGDVLTAVSAISESLRNRVKIPVQSSVIPASKPRRYSYAATLSALAAIKENATMIDASRAANLSLFMCHNPKRASESDTVRPEHSCAVVLGEGVASISIPVAIAGYRSWVDAPTVLSAARISSDIKAKLGPIQDIKPVDESHLVFTGSDGSKWYRPYRRHYTDYGNSQRICQSLGLKMPTHVDVGRHVADMLDAAKTDEKLHGSFWMGYSYRVMIFGTPNIFFENASRSEEMLCMSR